MLMLSPSELKLKYANQYLKSHNHMRVTNDFTRQAGISKFDSSNTTTRVQKRLFNNYFSFQTSNITKRVVAFSHDHNPRKAIFKVNRDGQGSLLRS